MMNAAKKIQVRVQALNGKFDIKFDVIQMTEKGFEELTASLISEKLFEIRGPVKGATTIIRGTAVKDSIITIKEV